MRYPAKNVSAVMPKEISILRKTFLTDLINITFVIPNIAPIPPPMAPPTTGTMLQRATELPHISISKNGKTDRTTSYHFNAGVSTISSFHA